MTIAAKEPHGFLSYESVLSSKGRELAHPGSRYLLELATFCDFVKRIQVVDSGALASKWISDNKDHLSDSDFEQLRALLGSLIDASREAAEALRKLEDGEAGISPKDIDRPTGPVNEMFLDLVRKLVNHLNLNRSELEARAYLITAVSSFEILFGCIIRSIYGRNPTALNKSEYAFTLEELTQFASIDDARAALISRKIDAILMESVDNWSKWLNRTINMEFPSIIADWPVAREVFARRNVLVHADGLVTARYIRDLKSVSLDTSHLNIGDVLGLSQTYVQESLERLIALGLLLIYAVWMRLHKTEKTESTLWLLDNQNELIDRELWLAIHLISLNAKLPDIKRDLALRIRVNGWLARKRLYGRTHIEDEVREWDISGLSAAYEMQRSLLLDEEKSDGQIIEATGKGELSRFQVATHPLYEEFRKRQPAHVARAADDGDRRPARPLRAPMNDRVPTE